MPSAFHVNNLLEMKDDLDNRKSQSVCPKHNDHLRVYCETCNKIICRDCAISKEHKEHKYDPISDCYPKYLKEIENCLQDVKRSIADIDSKVTGLDIREREIEIQGEDVKKKISLHAQQLIQQIQWSERQLSQQVDGAIKQKTILLAKQREEGERVKAQLRDCQELNELILQGGDQQQVLLQREGMVKGMKMMTQQIQLERLVPKEEADIKLTKFAITRREIGEVTCQRGVFEPKQKEAPPSLAPQSVPSPFLKEVKDKLVNTFNGLSKPCGVMVCDNGDILVAEFDLDCVGVLNREGRKLRSFGSKGKMDGQFTSPRGVAISTDGYALVTDRHRLQKLTLDGDCVKSVGGCVAGNGQLQFNYPLGVVVHPTTGHIFVADSVNNRIQVFDKELAYNHSITPPGNYWFNKPQDVALDEEGCLYIAEYCNHCVTKLTNEGHFVQRFGSLGSGAGQLKQPSSLAVLDGLVYVTERGNHRVSVFDTRGNHIQVFGKFGSGENEFKQPYNVSVDKLGNIYVSDFDNGRLIVFQ